MRQPHFGRARHYCAKLRRFHSRLGVTLIEMLVALAVTLILMFAVTQMFATVSTSISGSRAILEASERLRSAADHLRYDLAGLTCNTLLWQQSQGDSGYLEIIEGPARDTDPWLYPVPTPLLNPPYSPKYAQYADFYQRGILGDCDDAIFMTVRSKGAPFVGKNGNTSPVAEVAWYTKQATIGTGANAVILPWYNLYRRVLLVAPGATGLTTNQTVDKFQTQYDISARQFPGSPPPNKVLLNSLADLSVRGARFQHTAETPSNGTTYFTVAKVNWQATAAPPTTYYPIYPEIKDLAALDTTGVRSGEDIILTHVVGFDVKVWDAKAPVFRIDPNTGSPSTAATSIVVTPADPGYPKAASAVGTANPVSLGAFVDLYFQQDFDRKVITAPNAVKASYFYGVGDTKSTLQAVARKGTTSTPTTSPTYYGTAATYDTWTPYYLMKSTGGTSPTLEPGPGIDGLSTSGAVDNPTERTSAPPYAVPLRGIQVKIRIYEPDSKQVREVTVQESYVPD